MHLSVILIHGIGGSNENWADPIITKLQNKVLSELKNILNDKVPADLSGVLVLKSVYWKTALQKPQTELQAVLARYFEGVVRRLNAWDSLFKPLYKKVYDIQDRVVTLFVGDIVGYMAKEGKLGIEAKLDSAIDELSAAAPGEDTPLTFISHSLGTVVASNYIFDKMSILRQTGMNRMDKRFIFSNMFTLGSPIALFSMKFDGPESFNRPIMVEAPKGRWINFLDKDDPIAMPLRLLNSSYEQAVFSDYQVDSGWFWGTAHTEYFNKTKALDIIARKLAIDWVAANNKLPQDEIDVLYQKYDEAARVVK